jgi:hypothetical protein
MQRQQGQGSPSALQGLTVPEWQQAWLPRPERGRRQVRPAQI